MPEPILVLGMHRSGTSAVASVLAKLGGRAPKTLMPADQWNERGYFESSPIWVFHDELLASAGSTWDDWRKFNPSWFASAEAKAFRGRAKELFASEFNASSLPVLKDPRICRFAPFWLDLFKEELEAKPRIVIPIRSPLEVAQSLHEAQGMPLAKGMLLWLRHVLDAEAFSRNEPRSIFAWGQFLTDWRGTAEKIGAEAGFAWPRLSDRAGREIERFLARDLVHQRVAPADLASHSKMHEWTVEAYEALLELARIPLSNSAIEKLNELREAFDSACAMFGPALADAEIDAEELRARLAEFSDERDRASSQAAGLEAALKEAEGERERLAVELRRIGSEKERLADDLAEREARLAATAAALAEAAQARDELARSFSATKDRLVEDLADRDALLSATIAELSSARIDADARLGDLDAQLRAALGERERFAAAANAAEEARRRAEEGAAARARQLEAAHTAALAASEKGAAAKIRVLTAQLTEAEARAAKARRAADGPAWKRLLSGSRRGEARLLRKSGLFDEEWYKSQYPDAMKNGRSLVEHFLDEGYLVGCKPNPFFDPRWYLERYEDVRRAGVNPLVHYVMHGASDGRDPGPDFSTAFYLSANPDVRNSRINPLTHYLNHGRHEGRRPAPRT